MKTTKKVLSVFLAVVMIMSSMSVCFGTISFAANDVDAVNNFVAAMKCDAMKSFSTTGGTATTTGSGNSKVTTRTYTYQAKTYADYLAVKEVVRRLNFAIKGLDEYNNTCTHQMFQPCSSGNAACGDLGTVRSALESAIGTTELTTLRTTYHLNDLLNTVLNMESVTYRNKHTGVTEKTSTNESDMSQYYHNTLIVKNVSVKEYLLEQKSVADVIDNIDSEYKFTLSMGRANYTTTTAIFWTTNHYHTALTTVDGNGNPSPAANEAPKVNGESATNKNVLSEMETALNDNKDYLDKTTVAGVHSVSNNPVTLNKVADNLEQKYNAVKNAYGATDGEAIFNHFFGTSIQYDSVEPLVTLLRKAAIIAGYKSACEIIAADYKIYTDGTYKTYTSTEVNALYNELKTAHDFYKSADDSLEAEIASYYGIDSYIADIPGALDVLLAYYYDIFLSSIKDRAYGDNNNGYISEYSSWTVEDIDNDVITSADILTALNEVTLDIDTLIADASDEAVQSQFGMSKADLIAALTAVKTHLEELGYYAGLNDQLYAQYNTFTNNIVNVINADSSKLYDVLSGYEAWHQNLQSFFTTWEAEVGEYKDLLEDNLQATMNTYMQEAYATLKARVVTQIDNAYGLYEVYYDMYGNNVTMASLTYFNTLKQAIDAIEHNAYNWMKSAHWNYGTAIDADSIAKYDALQVIYGQYGTFVANRGFDTYTQTVVNTVREDTNKDIARENADIDEDNIGEYEVADKDVEAIIDLLEAALKDDEIKALLGNLINKDEDGNPTGEPFDLANLINGLINDNLYTDNLINTIIQFLYPIVAKAFLDVWEGINPVIDTTAEAMSMTLDVHAILKLYDVDDAIESAGIAIAPANLAHMMSKNSDYKTKFADVISTLEKVTVKTSYNDEGSYIDPWQASVLFEDAVDENGEAIIDEKTGEIKQVYNLNWGVDDAAPENKRAAFVDAACAALCGLEPLLYALLLNQNFVSPNTADSSGGVRGGKIGVNGPGTKAYLGSTGLTLTLDPITLMFDISANDGYDNVLAPLFEMLGLTNIPHSEDMKNTKDFLEKGLFAMIDQLVEKVAANPIKTILDIVPNLVYALEADLIAPVLDLLEIEIYYEADAHYSALSIPYILPNGITGDLQAAMKAEKDLDGDGVKERAPELINVGKMIDLEGMGINLSGGLAGILEMVGIDIPLPDVSVLATAGNLVWNNTNRSRWTYSYQPAGVSGKAAHINANRADVLEYLVKYALGNLPALLAAFNVDTSTMDETVTAILDNLSKNADAATAGIVELLNQKLYDTLENYEWYESGFTASESADIDFTPATEIYLNPENDWTETKAEYVYDNLETIVNAILTMAEVDFNKETEEVETLEEFVGSAIDGLLSDKTLTSLAALLAKLDLNALLNKDKTEEELENAIDVNALVEDLLGLDLAAVATQYADIAAAVEADEEYVYNFGVDAGTTTFAAVLAEMLEPLSPVLDFILAGGNLEITLGTEKVTLLGYDGYNNAIIPLLEALGCDVVENPENALEATLDALLAKIDALTTNSADDDKDGLIYGVIDMLPGILYFLSSNGLATTVRNLLQPVYVILDTIRPIYDLDLAEMVAAIEIGEEGDKKPLGLDIDNLHTAALLDLVTTLTGLDLSELQVLIYDVCEVIGVEYKSVSTLQDTWKKGAYSTDFDQADMLTVVLSFLLEWVTVDENAAALDEMLGTDGIVANIESVFADASDKIVYGTPNWMYWFETEEEFNDYVNGNKPLPNTLDALTYPNNWNEYTADYIAENLSEIVDEVIALIEINGEKYDSVADLIDSFIGDYISGDSLDELVGLIAGLLEDIDDNLLEAAGRLLDVDIVGLKNYKAPEGIDTTAEFAAELANVLTTYAGGLMNWLFFGDDYAFAKKSDNTDTIVINGGLGYEKGLALILEALGVDAPAADEATTANVLGALADRIDEILADPVNEVIDLLPNIIYFLNANGAGVAVDNLLQPVYALVDKVNALGILEEDINIEDLIKFKTTDEDGNEKEVKLNLALLSLQNIVDLVEELTDLDLTVVEEILVDFCLGKIEKADYTFKMTADRKDTITVIVTTVLLLVKDEGNKAILTDLLGEDAYQAIINIFNMKDFAPDMQEMNWILTEYADTNTAVSGMKTSELYEGWGYGPLYTEEMAQYIADNFGKFVDNILFLLGIEINGVSVESLQEIFDQLLGGTLYTTDTLNSVLDLLKQIPSFITDFAGADLTKHVNEILKLSIGVDLTYWDTYEVAEVSDRDGFVNELCRMLEPFYPVLKWLLADENFAFFVDELNEGEDIEDMIVLYGAEGYAYGIAPILEALQCEGVLSNEDYLEAVEANDSALLTSIINPLLDKVDSILYAEENGSTIADEVLALLPSVIYFINSNGLDTSVKNLLNAVYTVLNAIEPITGEINLYDLIGLDLENLTFEEIFDLLIDMIEEATGYDLSAITADYLAELTTGYVVSYTTASGKTAYTMVYAEEESGSAADMVTIILRLAVTFLGLDENQDKVLAILAEQFNMDADAQKYLAGVFDALAECETETYLGMDKACAVIYYLFYGLDIGADFAATGVKDLNSEWQKVLEDLGKTPAGTDATVGNLIARFLDVTMKDILDDVLNSDAVAPNGFISFFQRIIDWFKALMAWFQGLFA